VDKRNLWLGSAPAVDASTEVSELSLWVQDTWQISPRFTLAPGLRWEFDPSPVPAGTFGFLDPVANTIPHEHRPLWPATYTNFAPRLGLAWKVRKSGRTVLRAGGGLFYDSSLSIGTDLINGGPLSISSLTSGRAGLFNSILSYAYERSLH